MTAWADDDDDAIPATPQEELLFFAIIAIACLPWLAALGWLVRRFGGQ